MMIERVVVSALISAAIFVLPGCAEKWIASPSPQVRTLVRDLQLEGYECQSRVSEVVCTQKVPMCEKQPSICDSNKGCVPQPVSLLSNFYIIKQQGNGIPSINHGIEKTLDTKKFVCHEQRDTRLQGTP